MFDQLGEKIQKAFKKLSGKGLLNEKDIDDTLREIRMALLEADVNFKVVKSFLADVKTEVMTEEVMRSLTPSQQVIKAVDRVLTKLLGGSTADLKLSGNPAVIMLAGVQGSGKTTSAAKLALYLKQKGKRVLTAACDTHRAAAAKQLEILCKSIGVDVRSFREGETADEAAANSFKEAKAGAYDVLIVDTAGRQHVDEELMDEITRIAKAVNPCEILFAIDCMAGQSAVDSAKAFDEALKVTGFILTKADSDARGGAALSVSYITGRPIKFSGTGEKLGDFEVFHPQRMSGRILGMGDMLTLIEKAEKASDAETQLKLAKKMAKNQFTFEDYLTQLDSLQKMGGIGEVLKSIPGAAGKLKGITVDEKAIVRVKAIIQSMTVKEREEPSIINASRRRRIAAGSGTTVTDVNRVLNSFSEMKKMMKRMNGNKRKMKFPFM